MRITHLGHAAVLVESDQSRILIDPGNLSEAWHGVTDLDAILVTHVHPDHLDPQQMPALLAANPGVRVYTEPSIPDVLAAADLELGTLNPVLPGAEVSIGRTLVSVVGGVHAEIHRDIPRIGNVGFVLRAEGEPTLFHPGDSYATTPPGIDIVAMPAHAPWAAVRETIDFMRALGALEGFPVHEQLLNDRGLAMVMSRIDDMTNTRLVDLRSGVTHSF